MQAETRNKVIRFRVSESEYSEIMKRVPSGETLSDVARAVLISANFTPKKDIRMLANQIARIGNNLNQIAYAINHAHLLGNPVDAVRVLHALHQIRNELTRLRR